MPQLENAFASGTTVSFKTSQKDKWEERSVTFVLRGEGSGDVRVRVRKGHAYIQDRHFEWRHMDTTNRTLDKDAQAFVTRYNFVSKGSQKEYPYYDGMRVHVHVKTISPKHECFVVECRVGSETLTTFPFRVKSICKNDETSSEDEEEDSDDSDEEESDDDSDDDDSGEDEVTTKRRMPSPPPREAKKRKTVAIQCNRCITRSVGTQVGEFDFDESESLGGSSPLWATGFHF